MGSGAPRNGSRGFGEGERGGGVKREVGAERQKTKKQRTPPGGGGVQNRRQKRVSFCMRNIKLEGT